MVYSLFHRRHDDDAIPVLTEIIDAPEAADAPAAGATAGDAAAPASPDELAGLAALDAVALDEVAVDDDVPASAAADAFSADAVPPDVTAPVADAGIAPAAEGDAIANGPAPDADAASPPLLTDYLLDTLPAALASVPTDYDPDDLPVMTEAITSPLMAFAPTPVLDAEPDAATPWPPLAEPAASEPATAIPAATPAAAHLLPPLDIPAPADLPLTPQIRPLPTALADIAARAGIQAVAPASAQPVPPAPPIDTDALAAALRDELLGRLRPRLDGMLDQCIADAVREVLDAELPRLHARIEAAVIETVGDAVSRAVASEIARLRPPSSGDA